MEIFKLSVSILFGIFIGFVAVEFINPLTNGGRLFLIFICVTLTMVMANIVKKILLHKPEVK